MKAWIVSVDVFEKFESRVIGLVSPRRGTEFMELYLENLHAALCLPPKDRIAAAHDQKSKHPARAIRQASCRVYIVVGPGCHISAHKSKYELRKQSRRTWVKWWPENYRRSLEGDSTMWPEMNAALAEFSILGFPFRLQLLPFEG